MTIYLDVTILCHAHLGGQPSSEALLHFICLQHCTLSTDAFSRICVVVVRVRVASRFFQLLAEKLVHKL